MKSIINGLATSLRHVPRTAVVFYGQEGEKNEASYATHHRIRQSQTGFELGPGVSLTTKNIADLALLARESQKLELEVIPERVIVANDDVLAWWVPAAVQHMSFDVSMHELPGKKRLQGIANARVPVPPLVFVLFRTKASRAFQGIYVYAMLENKRPQADTPLYRAPVLNVSDDGAVCWGNGTRPKGKSVNDTGAWQSLFFSSVFTHFNGSSPILGKDPYGFIADLIDQHAEVFPTTALKPMRTTLQKQLAKLVA